jgi:hypothetical protein
MARNFSTSLLKYTTDEYDDNKLVINYNSINKDLITEYILISNPNYFAFKLIDEGQTLEKISYDLYGTADYWDLLLILNKYDPLFDTVLQQDTIYELSEDKTEELNTTIFNGLLPINIKSIIQDNYYKKISDRNDLNMFLKYVKPEYLNEFLVNGFSQGYLI